jgi:exosome complex component RRP4
MPGERVLVLPGQEIEARGLKPGYGTYRENGKIYASVTGLLSMRPPFVRVIPFAGRYVPQAGDTVIAVVRDVGSTYWLVDLRAYHYAPLHHTGTPWKIEYGECGDYLHPGDAIVVQIEGIDPTSRIMVTMNGEGLGKLSGGFIEEVSPTKVPRIIGKGGSMIKMIQQATDVKVVVGQNGRIWIDGPPDGILKARQALEIIDREGQRQGLTDRIKLFLER